MNIPQHNLLTDTPSAGCFSNLVHCLLCGGTVSTRSPVSSPTPHLSSRKFVDLLQNDNQVQVGNLLLPDNQRTKAEQLPIVARLMGLETPVDMNWKPAARVVDESFNRSRSVNAVDCLLLPHFISPERRSGVLHRRVKTCLSFRESDFLVVCLEKNSKQCNQSTLKDASHQQSQLITSITERTKKGNRSRRRASACIKTESRGRSDRTGHSTAGSKSHVEHTDQLKVATTSRERTVSSRTARATWQNKDDYYRKSPAMQSRSRTKETPKHVVDGSAKLKSTKHRKDVMNLSVSSNSGFQESSVSGRLSSSSGQSCKMRERADNVRLRTEDMRRCRKIKNAEHCVPESFGEKMNKKTKCIVGQDLEIKRWGWENEGGFLYREYLSMVIELGILDELVNQMVHDLAFKCDA